MKDNVHQVINRNEKLDETENLATSLGRSIYRKTYDPSKKTVARKLRFCLNLEQGASMFETTTKKVEKKYYWENMKYRKQFNSGHSIAIDLPKISTSRNFAFSETTLYKSCQSILIGLTVLFVIYLVIG